jgi:superfamily II DNA or RNA helicase
MQGDTVRAKYFLRDVPIEMAQRIGVVLWNDFSFIDESVKFMPAGKFGHRDAWVRFYNRKDRSLPIGLIQRAVESLRQKVPELKITMDAHLKSLFMPPHNIKITDAEIRNYFKDLEVRNSETYEPISPYDHQIRLMSEALNRRRVSLMACTAAGKSLSIYGISRWLSEKENKKVLIVVPSSALVEQLYSDFKYDYGWEQIAEHCIRIHGESKDKATTKQKELLEQLNLGEEHLLKEITISTWQSLQNKDESFFKPFTAVLVDEAHGMRGAVIRDIVNKCINAQNFRVGLSGTLPENGLEAALIEGCLGKRFEVVRLRQLVELGLVTPVTIHTMKIPYKVELRPKIKRMNYQEETVATTNNKTRFQLMDLLVNSGKINSENNTIILYRQLTHLDRMFEYLQQNHPQFKYHIIKGEISAIKRNDIRKLFEQSSGNILIGTYQTLQQGVNIKRLDNLVMAESAKSMYMIMQSIGRTVRLYPNKTMAHIYDVCDDCTYQSKPRNGGVGSIQQNYSMKHYEVRSKFYKDDEIPVIEYDLTGYIEGDLDLVMTAEDEKKKAVKRAKAEAKKANKLKSCKTKSKARVLATR